jgi:two-component system chemotaxis response regulator CheY
MKTCLVVDDSRVIRKVARRILEDIGYRVQEAEDGQEALEWCRDSMPDAIFVDWMMPNLDGIGFIKALKREAAGNMPPVIFCTTENEEAHVAQAKTAGAVEILIKPFDKETLEASLLSAGISPR